MADRLGADWLAYLAAGGRWAILGRWDLPSGPRYLAQAPGGINVATGRRYDGIVENWGTFSDGVDLRSLAPSMGERRMIDFKEDAENPWFGRLLALGGRVDGSFLACYMVATSADIAPVQLWTGVLDAEAGIGNPAPRRWRLTFAPPDADLTSAYAALTLSETNRTDLPEAAVGQVVPEVWGWWDSFTGTQKGAVTAIRDSVASATYSLCWGWAYRIHAVRNGGTFVSAGGYSVSHPETGGVLCTRLTFSPDPGAGAVITADMIGLESIGDGSGSPLLGPTEVLEHMLHNRVFNRNGGRAWYTRATAPVMRIDEASFDAAIAEDLLRANGAPWAAGVCLTAATAGLDLITRYSVSTGRPLYWTSEGTLAIVLDEQPGDDYISSPIIRPAECGLRPFLYPRSAPKPCDRTRILLGRGAALATVHLDVGDSQGCAAATLQNEFGFGPASAR